MRLLRALAIILSGVSVLTIGSAAVPVASGGDGSAFPKRRPSVDPIWVGEKQEFSVSFLGFTGLHVEIEVLPHEKVGGRKAYHMRARARNSPLLGVFYDLDDTAESWLDYEGFFSHRFHLVQSESKLTREAWEEHDHVKGWTTYRNRSRKKNENPENSEASAPIPRFAQDTFSSFYFLRSLPLEVGDTYRIPVISEGNSMEIQATVLGPELVKAQGNKMQSLLIRLEKLDKAGNPLPHQNNLVWVTNDERRVLLRVDVTTRFGHVVGELKSFSPGAAPASGTCTD